MTDQIDELLFRDLNGLAKYLDVSAGRLPVKFSRGDDSADTLVILFHGAVDRNKREIPVFAPFIPGFSSSIHQLSISDPAMLLEGDHRLGWYAGYDGFELQRVLPDVISKFYNQLKAKRLVFIGTSGGGFSSLYYSWLFKDSLAIVGRPQTNIFNYYAGHRNAYVKACWPSLLDISKLADYICTDVCSIYKQSVPNTVIYVQSAGDKYHFINHCLPFSSSIERIQGSRFILETGFWGSLGHGGQAPPASALIFWLRVVLASPSLDVNDLLLTSHASRQLRDNGSSQKQSNFERHDSAGFNSLDLDLATRLKKWQMNDKECFGVLNGR